MIERYPFTSYDPLVLGVDTKREVFPEPEIDQDFTVVVEFSEGVRFDVARCGVLTSPVAIVRARLANVVRPMPTAAIALASSNDAQRDGRTLVQAFLLRAKFSEEHALDFAFDVLARWRDSNRLERFRELFQDLLECDVGDAAVAMPLVPLFIAAVTESYLLRDLMPERTTFRSESIQKVRAILGEARAEAIFARIA